MRISLFILTIFLIFGFSCSKRAGSGTDSELMLWYEQPAERWLEALPTGNGRLGAMVFGGVSMEHLGLNESTVWSGAPDSTIDDPEASLYLPQIRQLLFEEKFTEAEELITEHLLGRTENYGTHLPLAELYIGFPHTEAEATNYSRQLNLKNAISRVEYAVEGVNYTRECFTSWPDQLIVMRLTADKVGQLEFVLELDGGELPYEVITTPSGQMAIQGLAREENHSNGNTGVSLFGLVTVQSTDGKIISSDGSIAVSGASYATVLVSANTDFLGTNPRTVSLEQIEKVAQTPYKELRKRHTEDYSRLFSRVSIDLGQTKKAELPTDSRLKALADNPSDPQLYALFYQYARYLIISSSRADSPLPGNLQGIWNDHLASKMQWTCDFHLDINMQQNYWPVESGNLSECHEPLFKLIEGLVEPGRRTARNLYDADGWVAHVVTNAWGFTSPGWGLVWGLHVTGGTWIASHLWHHYEYTGDEVFLRERAYPILRENAIFFLDYMIEHPEYAWLVTGPSVSPENKFFGPDGMPHGESMGTTADIVLIDELFTNVIKSSEILGVDEDLREVLKTARGKLPPLRIGKEGQLQEWLEDFKEAVPNHRHTTHLISLYPGNQISKDKTPELVEAARVSLERRTSQEDWEDVEWSIGNLINFYARLGESERSYAYLHELLTEHTDMDLLTYSRASVAGAENNIFVLDGNTSGASGISEMLIQSYDGKIYLLPALPEVWPTGSFSGVCARGGFELDLEWKNGILAKVNVQSKLGKPLELIYGTNQVKLDTDSGGNYEFDGKLELK